MAKKPIGEWHAPVLTLPTVRYGVSNLRSIRDTYQTEMSRVADFDRRTQDMKTLFVKVCDLCEHFFEICEIGDVSEMAELYKLYDMALTQRSVLSAMIYSAVHLGSHGSALVDRESAKSGAPRRTRTLTAGACSCEEKVSPMPNPELWFETLLARQRKEMERVGK